MVPSHDSADPSVMPRERLALLGPQALSTVELLMILIGSGMRGVRLRPLAGKVAELFQRNRPAEISLEQLLAVRGIGAAKACVLMAAVELADRLNLEGRVVFNSPDVVANYLHEMLGTQKEMLVGLYLNARYELLHKEVLAVGSVNQTILHPRDVFSPIKQFPVTAIILAHNHPSGDPLPSQDDKEFTLRMQEAAELLGIELADHLILAARGRFSFREEKFL